MKCGWVGLFTCNLPGTYFQPVLLFFSCCCFVLPCSDLVASTDCVPFVAATFCDDGGVAMVLVRDDHGHFGARNRTKDRVVGRRTVRFF